MFDSDVLLEWQQQWGYNPHGLVSILPGACIWTDPLGRGAISYLSVGSTWLASDPFAPEEDIVAVAKSFLVHARNEGKLACFVPATKRLAVHAEQLGMDTSPIGVSPYFDLQTWAPRGDRAKKVRSAINQARRSGLTVEETSGTKLSPADVAELSSSWIKTHRTLPFGWVFTLDPLRFNEHKRFFIARTKGGEMMGLLAASPIPAREGWYLEDVLRRASAPSGTADLLIVEGMAGLGRTGSRVATLGTVLAANLEMGQSLSRGNHRMAQTIFRAMGKHMEPVYNFRGLHRFKTKFAPTWWEPEFVMFPPGGTHCLRVIAAIARAIASTGIWSALWNSGS